MKRVDFNAKTEYECLTNYKVLQEVFTNLGIDKPVDVSKLIKGRLMDSMEFMQWLKRYFDQQTLGDGITDYDAAARRALCKTGDVRGSGAASAPSLAEGGG
ncbi:Microtubule integrity protein mal3 [Monoraphidium neglectum]|uniref:Microtubule integrity protein mal3 n=1 Tax=Monoraphidium neglectum TaxID=145388 RepID=A0A0D2LCM4_9CHLO|nr:Microtubule integrity protein mal3 [Monoraphidium neglectum]KIZ04504.1 Microtubule integrity protein mal3 [Monoraphidium neglectum]|eukprot:XP_013903523.1 Microtubule integrity protein mal3 [Monoraphidium neglectum]